MSETSLAAAGPAWHGMLEGFLGGGVALVAATVSHASLPALAPMRPPLAAGPPPGAQIELQVPPRPPPAPVLIAFRPPLPDGEIGSPFGLRQLPWEDRARLHAGVDMEAPAPEPVLASADGVVTRMGEDAGYGRFVELTHAERITTLYGHMDRFAPGLAPGSAVKAGAAVGRIGSTGTSTGVHLHFEVHDPAGRPLNPELFLGRSFARLADLPLRAGRAIPRHVRVAFVSRIPRSKRAQMAEKAERAQALRELASLKVGGRVRSVIQPLAPSAPPAPPPMVRPLASAPPTPLAVAPTPLAVAPAAPAGAPTS